MTAVRQRGPAAGLTGNRMTRCVVSVYDGHCDADRQVEFRKALRKDWLQAKPSH